jgi:hypothetical protein
MKTAELTGAALDWAVAKCVGGREAVGSFLDGVVPHPDYFKFYPSTNWAQGGPIIEREGITLASPNPIDTDWCAMLWGAQAKQSGTTPLIAAMRCYVASKLGYEVEIPQELA